MYDIIIFVWGIVVVGFLVDLIRRLDKVVSRLDKLIEVSQR